jgi:excisionase family DNA binding protein
MGRQLRATAATAQLADEHRDRAAELAERWRVAAAEGASGSVDDDGEVYVTVAEVAAAYDVTPQAVYKWIHKGLIEAHARPGGSYRIPIEAMRKDERFDVSRARRLQDSLARRHEAQGAVSSDEMLEQMRSRRSYGLA